MSWGMAKRERWFKSRREHCKPVATISIRVTCPPSGKVLSPIPLSFEDFHLRNGLEHVDTGSQKAFQNLKLCSPNRILSTAAARIRSAMQIRPPLLWIEKRSGFKANSSRFF